MPKQINVKLGFEADTSQARKQIADLQKSLDGLLSSSAKQSALTGFDKEVSNAQQSVLKLKSAINNSLNADTGRLDLSKFNTQLNNSGLTLGQLSKDMNGLGADGQKAFLNLANSIVTAQKPMVESNKLLDNMWTALKNTARWQLSSSLLHGFMGALQGAYGYAQDLNKSLTDIAIVTGRSTDQMAAFAEQANKSAQALSVSTTAYTDAALIYYQQGLSDAEVKARTDITMQMSNVTGESAEHVSSYMTAIWNNFAEGSENLDHFADVITALGAATASSSEEIANGMQQFAAVADTVGLSYEYAATALATVVAQTRQSESTVGNSFRTIFSRLQGLKLGKTLEDGTSLNKYSSALATIGVNIKDQNGELKEMDTILNEIGAKWQTLTKDQQVALAQTVGGVRQYTNLIALFDNWDTFQENLEIANNSDGTLQKQADIYAESWEAAQKRVKAAWQAIYQDLIDDDFFISILNGLEAILHGVDGLIDALGGLPGVLGGIGVIVTSLFEKQMVAGIGKAQQQLKVFSGVAEAEQEALIEVAKYRMDEMFGGEQKGSIEAEVARGLKDEIDLNYKLKDVYSELNTIQKEFASGLIDITKGYHSAYIEALKLKETTEKDMISKKRDISDTLTDYGRESSGKKSWATQVGKNLGIGSVWKETDSKTGETQYLEGFGQNIKELVDSSGDLEKYEETLQRIAGEYSKMAEKTGLSTKQIREYLDAVAQQEIATKKVENAFKSYQGRLKETDDILGEIKQIQKDHNLSTEETVQIIDKLIAAKTEEMQTYYDSTKPIEEQSEEYKNLAASIEHLQQVRGKIQKGTTGIFSDNFGKTVVDGARSVSQLTVGVNSLWTAVKTFNDKDLSPLEKLQSISASIAFGLPSLINGISGLLGILSAMNPIILLIVGSIAGLIALFNFINTPAKRVKELSEKFEELGAAVETTKRMADETAAAYDNLVNTLDGLKDKKYEIDKLTEGTEEWRDAINESNSSLIEMLDNANLLTQADLFYDKDGFLTVKNAGELKESSYNSKEDARMLSLVTQLESKQVEVQLATAKAAEELWHAGDSLRTWSDNPDDWDNPQVAFDNTTIGENGTSITQEKLLEYAQAILNSGQEGVALTSESAKMLAEQNPQLAFLEQIADKQDILDGISSVVTAIKETDIASDAYKESIAREAAAKAGFDVPDLPESQLHDFYVNLYDSIVEKLGFDLNDLSSINLNDSKIKDEAYSAYANATGGKQRYIGGELVDQDNKVITDEVSEDIIKLAYVSSKVSDNFDLLYQSTTKNVDEMNLWTQGIQKQNEIARTQADQKVQQIIGEDNYSQKDTAAMLNGLSSSELNLLIHGDIDWGSEETLDSIVEKLKEVTKEEHKIPLKIDPEGLSQFKGKEEELNAEIQEFSEFLKRNYEDYEGLSEHIAECDAAADAAAASFIRFDDAMQDVSKNYKTWKKALDSKDIKKVNDAVKDLRKTYANLLDLDGSQISEDFLKSSENLDLLNTVLNGTEEEAIAAYEQLEKMQAIEFAKDISPNVNIDAFSEAYDQVAYWTDLMQLKMGDDFVAGDVNYQNIVDGLNAALATMSMSKEQADALMRSMNYSGELQLMPVNTTDIDSKEDAIADVESVDVPAQPIHLETSDTDYTPSLGEMIHGTVSSVRWNKGGLLNTVKKVANTVQSMRWQVADGSTVHYLGGAAPKVSNMPARNVSNGGGGGGGCFAAGTQISLKNLQKNIEDIRPGDLVLSYNERTHRNEFSKVVQTMIHNVYEKIYNLFVKNDKLVVTGNHRFLVIHNGKQQWMPAEDIRVNDLVLLSSGEWCKISNINIEKKFLTVYNFEVSNTHNYYVGESHILAHNKGGSSKPKKKKVEKKKEPTKNIKEPDRYHNIKEKIEDLNTEMDRLNKNKDRAYGKDRIKWMDEEIKKTEEQIKLTDEYIDEIKSYAKIDKEDLEKKLGSFISDADFDENGVLKDYEGLLAKIQGAFDDNVTAALNKATDEYNAAVDKFNASDQEDDATEEFENAKEAWDKAKETYDKEKEAYDERLKALKQYEDTINLLQEKEQERIDQLNELYDKWLARTTYKVEISLEMNEDDMNYLQWVYDNLGDSADKAADRISLLSKQMKTTQKDIATYKKGIEELFAQNGMDVDLGDDLDGTKLGERLDQLIQKMREQGGEPNIQEVIDKLSEYRDGLMDTYDTMRDLADAATENVVNAYDEWNERLQENLDLMDHYDSVIDTIKEIADLLGEDQLGLGDEQAKAYEQAKLDNQRNAAAIAKDNYDAIAKERERVQKLLETSESETEKKHWEEVLKNLQEAENEAMEEYLSRWRDALRQAEENYQASLARNEKAYQKAMSGGMGTLDMLQEQFDRQKELDDLYLDDYEKYKKLGDITSKINKNLANNPSPMIQEKMKDLLDDVNAKMENGADISEGEATILEKRLALLEAEDQLLAARNAKSAVRMTRDNEGNFSYTYTADTSKIEEAQQNYADKFYELLDYEKQYSDETQGNMLKSWQDFINKRNEILEDDMLSEDERNKAMERLQADYDKMVAYYSDELNMVMEEMSRLKTDDWKDMENILGRLLAGPEDFETDLSKTTLGQLTNAWSDPEGMAKSWREAADTLYTQDADARAAWVAANEETNRRVDTSTKEFAENYKSTLGEIVEASDEVAESAEKMAEEMPKAMTEVLNEAENFFNEFGNYIDTLFTNIQNIVKAINELKDVLAGVDPEYRTSILGDKVSKTADYELPVKPVSGATGMYTGEWGTGGKLAILHEKELLLNEADTQNILKAVDFVRNMPQFGGVFNINNNVDYSKLAAVGATDLQQQVHIDASFPNVESHTEIELALNNLINSASQYVNRK